MRIIGGALRGQRLKARPAKRTRPTGDRVREAIMSALSSRARLEGARVLDLFAGTGALGLEALSRGADTLLAVDSDPEAVACVNQNARGLGLLGRARALQLDLLAAPAKAAGALARTGLGPFTLVFTDPPYTLVQGAIDLLAALAERRLLADGAAVIVEHGSKQPPARPACFAELAAYRYGDTGVALWETIAEPPDS